MVSSGAAVVANPNWPKGKACDEESWSDEGYCRKNGDWYYLSKTLAEREAFAYAAKTGLDIVTICPSLVIGPLMQSTVNSSSKVLLNYLKGGCVMLDFSLFSLYKIMDIKKDLCTWLHVSN
uniref:NAD-dependent epimerase/dehydratase domain-containing protein n=1 Tax=Triticum urartu TaxID=4572 RepID=A0A8R7QJQ9_TRIUA